jgi:hypothetical protein
MLPGLEPEHAHGREHSNMGRGSALVALTRTLSPEVFIPSGFEKTLRDGFQPGALKSA